jgi:hypothetical protein
MAHKIGQPSVNRLGNHLMSVGSPSIRNSVAWAMTKAQSRFGAGCATGREQIEIETGLETGYESHDE